MTTPTNPTLEEQIARLQARIDVMEGDRRRTSRRRGIRMGLGIVTIAALLAVPIGVFASHSFTDVPDSYTFHTVIGRVKGAAITAGCTATKYCPEDPVTRGQMAAFLARTGGRNSFTGAGILSGVALSGTPVSLGSVTIKAGDVTGGYALVQLVATGTVYTSSGAGLPTYALVYVREVGTLGVLSSYGFAQVDQLADTAFGTATGTAIGSVTVPTGVSKSYEVVAYIAYGTGALQGIGSISATYVPFRGDGANAIPPAAPAPAPKPGGKSLLGGD